MNCIRLLYPCILLLFFHVSLQAQNMESPDGSFLYRADKVTKRSMLSDNKGNWQYKINGIPSLISFTKDNKKTIYRLGDTLFIVSNGSSSISRIQTVMSTLEKKGKAIVVQSKEFLNSKASTSISWIGLVDGNVKLLWTETGEIKRMVLDTAGEQLAFLISKKSVKSYRLGNVIMLYQHGAESPKELVHDLKKGIDSGLVVSDSIFNFSLSGKKLAFYLIEKNKPAPPLLVPVGDGNVFVDRTVWSYMDATYQSQQLRVRDWLRKYFAVIPTQEVNPSIVRIEHENERVLLQPKLGMSVWNDDFMPVGLYAADGVYNDPLSSFGSSYSNGEYYWNSAQQIKVNLVSLNDGARSVLIEKIGFINVTFQNDFIPSPDRRFILWFNVDSLHYFSYEVATRKTRNISRELPVTIVKQATTYFHHYFERHDKGRVLWMDNSVLIYDTHSDIWKLDLYSRAKPQCITSGYAAKNNLYFSLNEIKYGWFWETTDTLQIHGIKLDGGDLQRASFASFICPLSKPGTIKQISPYSVPPERYNLDLAESMTWKAYDGTLLSGTLVKPVNFDKRLRYPVVVQLYDENGFGDSRSEFCKVGMLVFNINMKYSTPGNRAEDVENCLGSLADFLKTLTFVNGKKIGLIGGSYGGYQCFLAAVRLHKYAAIVPISGVTNLFDNWTSPETDHQGRLASVSGEHGQIFVGTSPWERPDLFIKNSPLFYADRVTTPLLIVTDLSDPRVPSRHSIAFFKAMRRLGKKCWMVTYDLGDHTSSGGKDVMQFFQYFLLDKPMPEWMSKGMSVRQKSVTTGQNYDLTDQELKPGLLLPEENIRRTPAQKELLKHKTTFDLKGRLIEVGSHTKATGKK